MKFGEIDEFSRFVVAIVKKEQLLQGLFDFLSLAKEKNIDIGHKIVFLGEYQSLLFESIILDISYILHDKMKDKYQTRMQIELGNVAGKLQHDIDEGVEGVNYTVLQKKETLRELKEIRDSVDYHEAIRSLATVRDKYIAHKDPDFVGSGLLFEQVKLVIQNIKRCHEIRQLVINGIGKVCINSPLNYDHRNIIEALIIQQDIKALRDSDRYDENLWKTEKRFYSDNLDFWKTEIMPRMTAMDGDDEQA